MMSESVINGWHLNLSSSWGSLKPCMYIYIYIYVHYIKTNINRCIQTKIWVLSITCHDVIVWYRIQDGTYQQGFRHGILSHALLSSSHRWLNSEVYKLLLTSNTSKILPYINRLSILRWLGFPLFPTLGAFFWFKTNSSEVFLVETSSVGSRASPSSHFPQDLKKLSMPYALRATIIDPGANNVGVSSKALNVWVVYLQKDRIGGKCR